MNLFLLVILIAGAPAFGLEAILMGNKGSLSFKTKSELVKELLFTGFAIVVIPICLDYFLVLNPIYIITSVFIMIFASGGILFLLGDDGRGDKEMPDENTPDGEIKKMLKDRGLDQLISEDDSSEK